MKFKSKRNPTALPYSCYQSVSGESLRHIFCRCLFFWSSFQGLDLGYLAFWFSPWLKSPPVCLQWCCSIKLQVFFKRFGFQVTPQRDSKGNGWTHQTHSSSLLSYFLGGRWWYLFPLPNVFALHHMPSVNIQLLDSHFSFTATSQVE